MTPSIRWLGQPDCHDPAHVGGKAANLSRLAARFPVPPGFCLTTDAFQQWRAWTTGEGASPGVGLPAPISVSLASAYARLAEVCGADAPGVAVRSSAVDEDGLGASFAGQHETFLNISGELALADAVVRCWQSAFNSRAGEYRRLHGLSSGDVRVAVLVQQLVPADVSAVVFGANPVTGQRDVVMINASWGLGESIVGGTVTPDTFLVSKQDLAVIASDVATKTRMTVQALGGAMEVDVPPLLQPRPSITTEQAIEMARLAVELERVMGWPADIECAFHNGQLYLLQCRPITALR